MTATEKIPTACLAPPMTDGRLAELLAAARAETDPEIKDALLGLHACVAAWWELPESTATARNWRVLHGGAALDVPVRPLTAELVKKLDAVTPWLSELKRLSDPKGEGLFDGMPPGLGRDAAFTLLWFATEIALDREPMTRDLLVPGGT